MMPIQPISLTSLGPDSQLFAIGLNHETAPVAVRERLAFSNENLGPAVQNLLSSSDVSEAVILSTCNRTEIYCYAKQPHEIVQWLCQHHQLDVSDIQKYLYLLQPDAMIHHVFRVAAGLESMVLGETQILGQLKYAVQSAQRVGGLGAHLNKLFQYTFSVAKQVRTETGIGEHSVSMAAAALKLSEQILGDTSKQSILFVGAGEMIELVSTYFQAKHPKKMTIANRSLERGQELAHQLGAETCTLSDLTDRLHDFDVIVTCTASLLPLIGKGMVEKALKQRRNSPLVFVDLAVPRDVEPEVRDLANAYLYTVDDLGRITQENKHHREAAVDEAEQIINQSVDEFITWLQSRALVPTIKRLREHTEQIRRKELEKARRSLMQGRDPHQVIEELSQGLNNKYLHHPLSYLRTATTREHDQLTQLIHQLFNLSKE
jgi:glutamyl-tRNA reductase